MGFIYNRGTSKRPNFWGAFKDIDGRQKRARTGARTKADAYKVLSTWEARVAQAQPGLPTKDEKAELAEQAHRSARARSVTVATLISEWRSKYSRPRIKDLTRYKQTYGAYASLVEARPIASMLAAKVRRADVEDLRDDLTRAGYAPGTVKHAVDILGLIFEWAMDRELIPAVRSPCKGVELAEVRPSEHFYTAAEMVKLLDHAEQAAPDIYPLIAVGVYAGLRHGELAALTWACVDLDASPPRIEVRRSYKTTPKGGKPRTVPMHAELVPILKAWRERCPPTPEGVCFPVQNGERERWRDMRCFDVIPLADLLRACSIAVPLERSRVKGQPHERAVHALRHSTATLLQEAGVNGAAISAILGHAGGSGMAKVTEGYIHAAPLAYLASELNKWVLRPRPQAPAPAKAPLSDVGGELIDFAAERERRRRAG